MVTPDQPAWLNGGELVLRFDLDVKCGATPLRTAGHSARSVAALMRQEPAAAALAAPLPQDGVRVFPS